MSFIASGISLAASGAGAIASGAGALASGIGTGIGAAASGVGSAASGIASGAGGLLGIGGGSAAPTMAQYGSAANVLGQAGSIQSAMGAGGVANAVAGYGASAAGGGGLLGGMSWGTAAQLGGMGMSVMQAFGGSGATGYAPSEKIPLTKKGKKLKKDLYERSKEKYSDAERGIIDHNLTSKYISGLREAEQQRFSQSQKILKTAGARSANQGVEYSGNQLNAALRDAAAQVEGERADEEFLADQMRENFINAVNQGTNIYNLEKQAPYLRSQSDFAREANRQFSSSQRGQALGDVARLAGLMTMQNQMFRS